MKCLVLLIIRFTKTQVLIWDVEAQPNRHAVLGATNSRPDLVFTVFGKFFPCYEIHVQYLNPL